MDLPATQAMDDEDFAPTQKVTDDKEKEPARSLIGMLIIDDDLQHQIFSGNTIIGRQPECSIVLIDETVSKRHAEIEAESTERAIFIKDLGSSNKTKINNTKLRPNASYQIRDNDKLNFGKVAATFKIHRTAEDSFVACTPQVNRRAVIPDTPNSSMNDSSVLEGDVSTIPGTQADDDDSCFRRPQIPVRTSISNEHEQSPKHVPFTLDEVPSPLSNSKDDNDSSGVETQRLTDDKTKEMIDNSIYSIETQQFVVPEKTTIHSHNKKTNKMALKKSAVKKVLSEELENQSLEDVETQDFVQTKFHSSSREEQSIENVETQPFIPAKSGVDESDLADVSIHSAATQKIVTTVPENKPIEDLETQTFIPAKSGVDESDLADVSIHSAATQKIVITVPENKPIEDLEIQTFIPAKSGIDESNLADMSIHSAATQKVVTTVPENKPIEDLETQPFTYKSFSSDKRKSANTSIYSAETQKVIADISNQSLDDTETQKFDISNSDAKTKLADVSIYSAATQKIGNIENLETQKFESSRASLGSGSHQIAKEDEMASSFSFSIQDIDTMPFTKHELSLDGRSNVDMQNEDDDLLDSVTSTTKSVNNKEVNISENSKSNEQIPTPSKKSGESHTADEINENIVQNQKQSEEMLSKSMSNSLLQCSTKFDKSKSLVESDDEEEIFSQNLIENCPFRLLLDDSKNDDSKNEQSTTDLQNDKELVIDKTVDSKHEIPSNNPDNSTVHEDLITNKSTIAANDDSETDEEGVFSSNSFKEKENEKLHTETGNDSETDEEGVFSNHLTEKEGEKSNSKPEGDSETDEEGVFSGRLSTDSKKSKSSNYNRIINESESDDEGGFSNNQSKNKASKDSVDPDENVSKTVENSSFANKSTKKVISPSPKMERSLNKMNEIVQAESPIPESDDDIFNENDEEKRTSYSGSDKTNGPAPDKDKVDPIQKSLISDTAHSEVDKNDNDNNDLDPTQLVETEDLSLAPTQIVNTNRASSGDDDRSEEADDLAPTQLVETHNLQNQESDAEEEKSKEVDELAPTQLIETQSLSHVNATVPESVKEVAQAYDDMDVAPTQKMVETQDCTESLAPTQKVVDTHIFSEEMGALQFSESLGPTQIIEDESNDVENEIVASPSKSPNQLKRQLEEVEITNSKKLKTSDGSQKVNADLNSTVEQNLSEMFEGSEVKTTSIEEPIETQRLESILESSQIEESSATTLDVSINKSSPTLSSKRTNIRSKNRRKALALNKSSALNETSKSVANLNDTIEHNLNELFDNSVDNVETPEPEPMLTQQLENVLNSSQDSSPTESKNEEERRTLNVSRRRSILSLSSRNLNKSIAKIQNDEEKSSKNVQSISQVDTISRNSLREKSPQNEDYPANLEQDNAISEKKTSENDKAIVYRRGTIGFTEALQPVSTFDRVAFLDKYSSTSDSQSDVDDIVKLRRLPSIPSSKKHISLRLKSVDLNSVLTSSTTNQDIEKKNSKSPVLSAKKVISVHHRSAKRRNPVVRLCKLSSPLYRKHAKPVKRVMACGTIGFLENTLEPVESAELVSAASTESEDDLIAKVGLSSPKTVNEVGAEGEQLFTDLPMVDVKTDNKSEQLPIDTPMEKDKDDAKIEQLPIESPIEDDKDDDSSDDFFKDLPVVQIAGTVNNPATSSQLAMPSDHDTDSESIKSVELPDRWKWYAERRFDVIYDKCKTNKKRADDSDSGNGEDEDIKKNNVTDDSLKDDLEERRAAIDKILAQVELGKDEKKSDSNRGVQNNSSRDNAVSTRSRKLRKSKTPSPIPDEDSGSESDKTNPVLSSSSDSEGSEKLNIIPTYRPVSPLKFNALLLTKKEEDEDDSEKEFEPPRINQMFKPMMSKPSPPNARRRRKSACNNDVNVITKCENNAVNKKLGTPIIRNVVKDRLVFQGSRDSKMTATTTTRTLASATTNRTKRIIDSDEDDESTHQPSPKRAKTLANRQKLQQVTVVISPLADKLKKLSEANRLNVNANESSNFKQPVSTQANKRSTRATKTLDNYVAVSKTSRTDSSDMSAVESSIVEDKHESKNKSKVKGKPAARTRKAKVETSSEQSANSSKENLEESDVQKPKTRVKERKNKTQDSSLSEKESSRDEIPTSDVENKSTRSTRGRLVRKNRTKKEEEKPTIKDSKVIQDPDSEESQKSKITVRNNTTNRSAKTFDECISSKIDATADSTNDNIQDKDQKSQSSSQSESVVTRTTRTRKNKANQESDSASSETREVATTRGSRRKPVKNKSDIVIKLADVDSNKETMIKTDAINDEVNVFKLMKKKMNIKPEEPSAPSAKKTRTRGAKNVSAVEENSSEESQEVSEIMKNNVLEDSKTTTRRRGRATKTNSSYVENTESSDDLFEKPTSRPKRARMTKADKNKSSHILNSDEEATLSTQRSTRKKLSPSPTLLSDAALTPSTARSSRLSLSSPTRKPKVLFTGEKSEVHRRILTKLGGAETEEFNSCSVLITDKVRRTFKFLCSLAQGIPIASVKWLDESKKANHFLDLEEYILNDPDAEAKFKFNLKESLDKAKKHKLLEGYTIVLSSKIKQPPINELKEMVISSGGKPLVRAPAKWPGNSIVVTTEQEIDSAKKLIVKAPKSVTVQSVEFILTGILRQNINFNEFKLLP